MRGEFDQLIIRSSNFMDDKVVHTYTKKTYLNDVHLGACEYHYEALICYLAEGQ